MSNKLCKALPEELKAEIKSKAHRSADAEEKRLKQKNYTYDRMVTRVNGYLCGHIAGATEYASKLYLLQQEYEAMKIRNKELSELYHNLLDKYKEGEQEYDKLNGDYEKVGDALEESVKTLSEEMAEHAALKERADKMAKALVAIKDGYVAPKFLAREVLSSYNSNTNQNENNG